MLLRKACELAARKDLREHRQSFRYWLKLMHEGGIDPDAARVDMLERLRDYRAIIAGSGWKTAGRWVAKIVPVSGPALHLLEPVLPGISHLVIGLADVAGVSAPLIVEPLFRESRPDERVRPAALVHDIRKFFGKK